MAVFLLSVVSVLGIFQITGAFQCYSCTYKFAGHDGTHGYDCVNNTKELPTTRIISCELPKKCVVESTYAQNYNMLLWMIKTCMVPTLPPQCQGPDLVRPVCTRQCTTDLCNDIDGNFKEPFVEPSSGVRHTSYFSVTVGISMYLLFNML